MPDNDQILAERVNLYDQIEGPRVGDYLLYPDGSYRRFSHDWGEDIQVTCGKYGGSFYLGNGYVSYSGALDPAIPKDELVETGQYKKGRFWFFDRDYARAGGGIETEVLVRVYRRGVPVD
jgi:hypothetical protein